MHINSLSTHRNPPTNEETETETGELTSTRPRTAEATSEHGSAPLTLSLCLS